MDRDVRGLTAAIDDYLLVWVLLAVAIGFAVPELSALAPLSTTILAIMIGSISLTLSPAAVRTVQPRALSTILVVQTGMPVVAYAVARGLGLSAPLVVGFVWCWSAVVRSPTGSSPHGS